MDFQNNFLITKNNSTTSALVTSSLNLKWKQDLWFSLEWDYWTIWISICKRSDSHNGIHTNTKSHSVVRSRLRVTKWFIFCFTFRKNLGITCKVRKNGMSFINKYLDCYRRQKEADSQCGCLSGGSALASFILAGTASHPTSLLALVAVWLPGALCYSISGLRFSRSWHHLKFLWRKF